MLIAWNLFDKRSHRASRLRSLAQAPLTILRMNILRCGINFAWIELICTMLRIYLYIYKHILEWIEKIVYVSFVSDIIQNTTITRSIWRAHFVQLTMYIQHKIYIEACRTWCCNTLQNGVNDALVLALTTFFQSTTIFQMLLQHGFTFLFDAQMYDWTNTKFHFKANFSLCHRKKNIDS